MLPMRHVIKQFTRTCRGSQTVQGTRQTNRNQRISPGIRHIPGFMLSCPVRSTKSWTQARPAPATDRAAILFLITEASMMEDRPDSPRQTNGLGERGSGLQWRISRSTKQFAITQETSVSATERDYSGCEDHHSLNRDAITGRV